MPPEVPTPLVEVAAAIIEVGGRYLIGRRRDDPPLGGFWEFPGGKRNPGESLEHCLRREVWEEIGVETAVLAPFERIVYEYRHATIDIHFFCCAIVRGWPQALGCAELRWVARAELSAYRFPPANTTIIERLQHVKPSA